MSDPQGKEKLIAPLLKKYMTNLSEKREILNGYKQDIEYNKVPKTNREEITLIAHSLSGSGATYGFPEISEKAALLEAQLKEEKETEEILTTLTKLLDILTSTINAHRTEKDTPPESTAINNETLPLILIADDDESIRAILKEHLKEHANIIECETAKEALKLMQKKSPKLVLLDDKMPGGLHGIQLLEKIQHTPKIASIPVIMITANNDSKEVLRGLMAGAVDYILKPIQPEQVASRIIDRLTRNKDTILIADDDEAIRHLLTHKLLRTGCRIITTEEGAQTLEVIEKEKPSLVILDRMMPGLDGFAVLKKIKQNKETANIPVIFLTAKQKEEDVVEGINLGAVDYIIKPFNPEVVVAHCIKALKAQDQK